MSSNSNLWPQPQETTKIFPIVLLYYVRIYICSCCFFVVQIAGVLITRPQPKLKEHSTFFELECSVRFTNDNFRTAIQFLKSTIDLYSPQVTPTDTHRWASIFFKHCSFKCHSIALTEHMPNRQNTKTAEHNNCTWQ